MTTAKPAGTDKLTTKNYPDVLGLITQGQRYNLDVMQVAVATRPGSTAAGRPFDTIVLLQNTLDAEVDVLVNLILPDKDQSGQAGTISSGSLKPVRIGLHPGEVGYVNLPVLTTQQTKPGKGYIVQVEIAVEYKQKDAVRVRDASGGTAYQVDNTHPKILHLQQLQFSSAATAAKPGGLRAAIGAGTPTKARMPVSFEILPPVLSGLPSDLKADYISLWTAADYRPSANMAATTAVDDLFTDDTSVSDAASDPVADLFTDPEGDMIAAQPVPERADLLAALKRANVFFILLKFTQYAFDSAQYRLWAGECILITKLLTDILEVGETGTSSDSRWIKQLDLLLAQDSPLVHGPDIEGLLTDGLYTELIYDAVMTGFPLLADITGENFGTTAEMGEYADAIVASLAGSGDPIDLIHTYLPLALGGLLLNDHVAMPDESAADTLTLFRRALAKRDNERSEDNQFIFDMAERLFNA